MFGRKKMVLKYTPVSLGLEAACFILLMVILLTVARLYSAAPELVPRRFALSGAVTEWGNKPVALLPAISAVFFYTILTGLGILMRRLALRDDPESVLSAVLLTLLGVKAVYLIYAALRSSATLRAVDMLKGSGYLLPVGFTIIVLAGGVLIWEKAKKNRRG